MRDLTQRPRLLAGLAGVARLAVLGALAVAACDSPPPTGIVLEIDSDLLVPEELDGLEVIVSNARQTVFSRTVELGPAASQTRLPTRLGLVPQDDGTAPITIDVTGRKGRSSVVTRRAVLPFVQGQVLLLHIELLRECAGKLCAELTCKKGGCGDPKVDPKGLPPYVPSRDGAADTGSERPSPDGIDSPVVDPAGDAAIDPRPGPDLPVADGADDLAADVTPGAEVDLDAPVADAPVADAALTDAGSEACVGACVGSGAACSSAAACSATCSDNPGRSCTSNADCWRCASDGALCTTGADCNRCSNFPSDPTRICTPATTAAVCGTAGICPDTRTCAADIDCARCSNDATRACPSGTGADCRGSCSVGISSPCGAPVTVPPAGGRFTGSTAAGVSNNITAACGSGLGTGISPDATFTWTPTTSGSVTLSTAGSAFDTILLVRTVADCTNLGTGAAVATTCLPGGSCCNDDDGAVATSRLTLTASAGTTYYITLDGKMGGFGSYVLEVAPGGVLPACDSASDCGGGRCSNDPGAACTTSADCRRCSNNPGMACTPASVATDCGALGTCSSDGSACSAAAQCYRCSNNPARACGVVGDCQGACRAGVNALAAPGTCAAPVVVPAGAPGVGMTFTGTTAAASGQNCVGCAYLCGGGDAVFRWTPAASGTATIAFAPTGVYSGLYVRTGSCAAGAQVALAQRFGPCYAGGGSIGAGTYDARINLPVNAGSSYWIFADTYTGVSIPYSLTITPPGTATACTSAGAATDCGTGGRCSQDGTSACTASADCNRCSNVPGTACTPAGVIADCGASGTCSNDGSACVSAAACNRCSNESARACSAAGDCRGVCKGGTTALPAPGTCAAPVLVPPGGGVFTGTNPCATGGVAGTCPSTGAEAVFRWTPTTSGTATFDFCTAVGYYSGLHVRTATCAGAQVGCATYGTGCNAYGSRLTLSVVAGTTYVLVGDSYSNGYCGAYTFTVTPPASAPGCTTATALADCGGATCANDGLTCAGNADCNRCSNAPGTVCTAANQAVVCGSTGVCGGTASGACSAAADCNRCSNDTSRTCSALGDCRGVCRSTSYALGSAGTCAAPVMIPPGSAGAPMTLTGTAAGASAQACTGCFYACGGGDSVFQWTAPGTGTAVVTFNPGALYSGLYVRTGSCAAGAQVALSHRYGACYAGGGAAGTGTYDARINLPVTMGTTYWIFADVYTGSGYAYTLSVTPPGAAPVCATASAAADCGTARACSQDAAVSCAGSADCNRCAVSGVQNATPCTIATAAADCGSTGTCSNDGSVCSAAANCNRCSNDAARACGVVGDCRGRCRNGAVALTVIGKCATPTLVPAGGGTFSGALAGASSQSGSCQTYTDGAEAVFQWTPSASGTATFNTTGSNQYHHLYVRSTTCVGGAQALCFYAALGGSTTVAVTSGTTYFVFVDLYGSGSYNSGNFVLTITAPVGVACSTASTATDCGTARACSQDTSAACSAAADCNRCMVGGVQNATTCTAPTAAADCGNTGTCSNDATICTAAANCNRCNNDAARSCSVTGDCRGRCAAGPLAVPSPGTCPAPTTLPPGTAGVTMTLTGTTSASSVQNCTGCASLCGGGEAIFQWTPAASGTAAIVLLPVAAYAGLYVRTGTCAAGAQVALAQRFGGCYAGGGAIGSGTYGARIDLPVTMGTTYWIFADTYTGAGVAYTLTVTPPGSALVCQTASAAADCGTTRRCAQDPSVTCTAGADCNRCTLLGVQSGTPCTAASVATDCGTTGVCGGTASGACSAAANCNRCSNDTLRSCAALGDCRGVCRNASVPLASPGTCAAPVAVMASGGVFTGSVTCTAGTNVGSCGSSTGAETVFQWTPTQSGTAIIDYCTAVNYYSAVYVRTGTCAAGAQAACATYGTGCNAFGSRVLFSVTAGTTYFIFGDSYSSAYCGAYTLTVTPPNAAVCSTGSVATDCAGYTSPTCDMGGITCVNTNPCNVPTCTTTNTCGVAPSCDMAGVSCTTSNTCNNIPSCTTTNTCGAAPSCDMTGIACTTSNTCNNIAACTTTNTCGSAPSCDMTGIACTASNPCALPACVTTNACRGAPSCDLAGVSCTTSNTCSTPTCITTNTCSGNASCDLTGIACNTTSTCSTPTCTTGGTCNGAPVCDTASVTCGAHTCGGPPSCNTGQTCATAATCLPASCVGCGG